MATNARVLNFVATHKKDSKTYDFRKHVAIAAGDVVVVRCRAEEFEPQDGTDPSIDRLQKENDRLQKAADERGLLFSWPDAKGEVGNRKGNASIEGDQMVFARGYLKANDKVADRVKAACRQSNQLSIVAVLTPHFSSQEGPARIISFSHGTGTDRNFTLGHEKDHLVLRLNTKDNLDVNNSIKLEAPKLEAGKTYHVVITYDGLTNTLRGYVNGQSKGFDKILKGGFDKWGSGYKLLFGDESTGDRPWYGVLNDVQIFSRAIPEHEIERHYKRYQGK